MDLESQYRPTCIVCIISAVKSNGGKYRLHITKFRIQRLISIKLAAATVITTLPYMLCLSVPSKVFIKWEWMIGAVMNK